MPLHGQKLAMTIYMTETFSELRRADDGEFEGKVDLASWFVPAFVKIDGDRLLWKRWDGSRRDKTIRSQAGLLERFVALDSPERVEAFARRWGVLMLCKHHQPASHNHHFEQRHSWCYPLGFTRGFQCLCWEPLEGWYGFSRAARAILSIATNLRQNSPGSDEDWNTLAVHPAFALRRAAGLFPPQARRDLKPLSNGMPIPRASRRERIADHKGRLTNVLRAWIDLANVGLDFAWYGDGAPIVKVRTSGLFGVIATQLVTAVTGVKGFALCCECGNLKKVDRQPRSDGNFYCKDCGGTQAAQRHAAKAYRTRLRSGRLGRGGLKR